MTTLPQFTAAQIAVALDRAPRSIRRALDGVPHSSVEIVHGSEGKVWSLESLPSSLRADLDAAAAAKKYRDALSMLRAPAAAAWKPRIPLNDVADECRQRAVKLQRALLPALERYDAGELAGADLEACGLADYKSTFGNDIAPRTWRYLFQRTRDRARTAADYVRVELFLDDNCARKRVLPTALSFDDCFGGLHQLITSFADPTEPTPTEKEALWFHACKLLHPRATEKAFKRALLHFLWNFAPHLVAGDSTKEALRVNLGRKMDRWESAEEKATALRDGRLAKRGEERAEPFAQSDLDTITAYSLFNCGGRLAQGARELRELGERSGLSRAMRRYLGNEFLGTAPENKSHVPTRLRDAVRHELAILKPHRIGPRAADSASAWLQRDWSNIPAMYAITMDDVTLPVYFTTHDKNGKVILTRGQCLIAVDCRSWRILGFSLQPDRNYNSRVIRTLITKVCSERGLPKIFYFERGIWMSSKLIKGNAIGREMRSNGEPFSWPECEHGLSEFGVKFIHAIRPRSKIVERVIGALQSLMEGEPGYCGREERKDRPEQLAKQMYTVEHGEDPSKWFYSFAQWEERLHALCEKYNAERQCGEILAGRSPNTAFEECQDTGNPPEKFGADCRYLLAHQKITKVVGNNGITLQFGEEKFVYRDAQTGPLRGQTVLCWFDPDASDHLVITDINRKNPISVERAEKVQPFDTDSEKFRHEIGKAQAHSSHARARYRVLRVAFREEHRRVVPDRATRELGEQIEQQRTARTAAQKEHESLHRKAARLHEALGMPTALVPRDVTPEYVQGLEDMRDAGRPAMEEPEQESAPAPASSKKVYVLDAPSVSVSLPQLRAIFWKLWRQVEVARPNLKRHAITSKALGYVKKVTEMDAEELQRVSSVFAAILRKEQT